MKRKCCRCLCASPCDFPADRSHVTVNTHCNVLSDPGSFPPMPTVSQGRRNVAAPTCWLHLTCTWYCWCGGGGGSVTFHLCRCAVVRRHGGLLSFLRTFFSNRPLRNQLKQSGIVRERVFGCDLGEHLLNSGHHGNVSLSSCGGGVDPIPCYIG